MDRQIHDTARHAWQRAELAEARQRAVALAGDVVAYHAALVAAGIDGELVATLVTQFNRAWLEGGEPSDIEASFMLFGGDV